MENEKLYPLNTGGAEGIFAEDGSLESVNQLDGEVAYRTGVTTSQAFKHALKESGKDVAYFATPETLRKTFEELRGEGELKFYETVNGTVAVLINSNGSTTKISTVEELVAALENEEVTTVKLEQDLEFTEKISLTSSKNIDGNGHVIEVTGGRGIVASGEGVEVKIDNVEYKTDTKSTILSAQDGAKVEIGKNASVISSTIPPVVVNRDGTVEVNGKITNTGADCCISSNGMESGIKLVVNEGAVLESNDISVLLTADGETTINGGEIIGKTPIGIKSGKLTINGGKLTANGEFIEAVKSNDGMKPWGDAIAVEVNKSYAGGKTDKNIQINIAGGEVESANGYIIREFNSDGSDITIDVKGKYSVKNTIAENVNVYGTEEVAVLSIEELTAAVANENIKVAKLTKDIELTDSLVVNHSMTIDGNGFKATGNDKDLFKVMGTDTTLVVKNINMEATGGAAGVRVGDRDLGTDKTLKAIIEKDVTITAESYAVKVFGENSTVEVYGKLEVTGDGYCIAGNASEYFEGKTNVIVKEGAELKSQSFPIYIPQDGVVNVEGGYLEGPSVIGIKAGELNISGGKLVANGELVEIPGPTYDGQEPTGDVIAVEVNKAYEGGKTDKNIKINVTGGELVSANAYRIREVNVDSSDITIEVKGNYSVKTDVTENVHIYDEQSL